MEQLKGGESKVFSQVAVVSRTERLSSEFAGDGVLDLRGLPSASTFAATSARVKTDQPTLEYTSTVQHKKTCIGCIGCSHKAGRLLLLTDGGGISAERGPGTLVKAGQSHGFRHSVKHEKRRLKILTRFCSHLRLGMVRGRLSWKNLPQCV